MEGDTSKIFVEYNGVRGIFLELTHDISDSSFLFKKIHLTVRKRCIVQQACCN